MKKVVEDIHDRLCEFFLMAVFSYVLTTSETFTQASNARGLYEKEKENT